LTDPADLVQEACDLLAEMVPRLRQETPVPDETAFAAPGMTARPAAAPLPGNPPAFFAYTGIAASARWAEELLLYAVGASEHATRGGSDANTVRVLTEVIPKLAAGAGDDTYRMVITELEQRLDEARSVRAIDEAEEWRYVGGGSVCPFCRCSSLKTLLDARRQPGRIQCFGHREDGAPCRAAWPRLADIVPDLARADELTAPDLGG
jgi:hypothetical protein